MTYNPVGETERPPENDQTCNQTLYRLVRRQWSELGLSEVEFLAFFNPSWSEGALDGLTRSLCYMLKCKHAGAFEVCKGKSIMPILTALKDGDSSRFDSLVLQWLNPETGGSMYLSLNSNNL